MQIIYENDYKLGVFGQIFTDIYEKIENNDLDAPIFDKIPDGLTTLITSVYPETPVIFNVTTLDYTVDGTNFNNKDVLVGFTGGKDSVSTVLKLKELGYNPILFYLKGINRSYPNEHIIVNQLAIELNCPVVMPVIKLSYKKGEKSHFIENPIKNQYILSLMVDYGIEHGIKLYSMGNHTKDVYESTNVFAGLSDALELFEHFESFIKLHFPQFKYITPLHDDHEAYTILSDHPNIIEKVMSCMGAYRYRNRLSKLNSEKYSITVLPNRCYSCYKCCAEWIYYNRCSVVGFEDNPLFYKHCIDILRKNIESVSGGYYNAKTATETEILEFFGCL